MNCNEALEKITACRNLDEIRKKGLEHHLEQCENCRVFAEEWLIMKDIELPGREPELSADFVIRREAQRFINNRMIKRRSLIRWFTVAAAAACLVMGFIFVGSLHHKKTLSGSATVNMANSAPSAPQPIYRTVIEDNSKITMLKSHSKNDTALTPEMLQFLETEIAVANSNISREHEQPEKPSSSDWNSLDFSEDFFELEAKITYCQTSI